MRPCRAVCEGIGSTPRPCVLTARRLISHARGAAWGFSSASGGTRAGRGWASEGSPMDTALLHAALGDPGPRSGRGERGRSVLGSSKARMPNPQRQMGPPPLEQHGLWVSLCGVLGGLQGGLSGGGGWAGLLSRSCLPPADLGPPQAPRCLLCLKGVSTRLTAEGEVHV